MSLALFLAELRLQGHASTVVFDDPSTSFDHRNRRRMAERLAKLATDRPVVVFTHDAVFLAELNRAAGQSALFQTVGWDSSPGPGHVSTGLTWETMTAKDRMADLNESAASLNRVADYADEATKEAVKSCYTKLRGTIERAVREVFLNDTVRPFSDEVSVDSFGAVIGFPTNEWDQVTDIYARCCEVTDAHDTNSAHQLSIPEADELLQDIAKFQELYAAADKRKKAYEASRSERNRARKKVFAAQPPMTKKSEPA